MKIKISILLLSILFLTTGVQAKGNDRDISISIQKVWNDSLALNTFLGIAGMASTADSGEVEGLSREIAMRRAQIAAKSLSAGLRELALLKRKASHNDQRTIDEIKLVAQSRIKALSTILAISDSGELESVSSCDGWWNCIGFRTGCVGAGGKWEPWGAGVETCTT
jgi:hypothetical protein